MKCEVPGQVGVELLIQHPGEMSGTGLSPSTGILSSRSPGAPSGEVRGQDVKIELEDLTASYPPQISPNLQTLLSAKREYAELAAPEVEDMLRKRGCLFRHQLLFRRHLTQYPICMVIHDTGTGKTCTIAELFQYYRENRSEIRYAYILVSGPTQKLEFKRQLACICTVGVYETESLKRARSPQGQQMAVSLEIKKWFKIKTYASMAKDVAGYSKTPEGNAAIVRDYSGCIFFIDEVQNIKIDPFGGEEGAMPRERKSRKLMPLDIKPRYDASRVQAPSKRRMEREQIYSEIWRLFHLVERSKLVVASATPMVNDVGELSSHLNLILPLNEQLQDKLSNKLPDEMGIPLTGEIIELNLATATLEQLKPILQGRISYVRATEVSAIPTYIGMKMRYKYRLPASMMNSSTPVDSSVALGTFERDSQLVLHVVYLGEKQAAAYRELQSISEISTDSDMKSRNSLYNDHRGVVSFVFPDGKYGEGVSEDTRRIRQKRKALRKGMDIIEATQYDPLQTSQSTEVSAFTKYVQVITDSRTGIKDYKPTPELLAVISDPAQLRSHSAKTYEQVRRAVAGNKILSGERTDPEEVGKRYVYCRTVTGGGAIIKGLCYGAHGYERFASLESVFESIGGGLRPFCPPERKESESEGTSRYARRFVQGFVAKPRYAILSRTTTKTDTQVNAILELFNSPENIDGDYLQVLIVSPVGQYGINLNNVMHVEIDGPEWTPSSLYQARNRAFRATSHTELVERILQRRRSGGAAAGRIPIEVKVHLYATLLPPTSEGEAPKDTIDILMYKAAEFKDFKIRRMMRMLKQVSFDCQLHRARNIRDAKYDGTAECDYDVCNYPCSDPFPSEIDSSTYDVYYYDEIVSNVSQLIAKYFRSYTVGNLADFQREFPAVRSPRYFIFALERMIVEKVGLKDQYGYTCYIREDNGTFYTSRSFPHPGVDDDLASCYYSGTLSAIRVSKLEKAIKLYREPEVSRGIQVLLSMEENALKSALLNPSARLTDESEVALLEEALRRWDVSDGATSPNMRVVFNAYHGCLVAMEEPSQLLAELGRKISRGMPIKLPDILPIAHPTIFIPGNRYSEGTVFLHTLVLARERGTSLSEFIKYLTVDGKLRIYRPREGRWRDLGEIEKMLYPSALRYYLNGVMAHFQQNLTLDGIHGVLVGDRFLIRDMKGMEPTDWKKRPEITGIECESLRIEYVVEIMWRLGMPRPPSATLWDNDLNSNPNMLQIMVNLVAGQGIEVDRQTWDKNRLAYYYGLLRANRLKSYIKPMMCTDIMLWLASFKSPLLFSTKGNPMVYVMKLLGQSGNEVLKLTFQNYSAMNSSKEAQKSSSSATR